MILNTSKIEMEFARQGITQKELAQKIGIHRQNVNALLKRGNVRPKTAGRIAAALGVDISEIVKLPKEE